MKMERGGYLYLMKLPILPERFSDRAKWQRINFPEVQHRHEVSKTHTETWFLTLVVMAEHHVAYRVKLRDQFGYGG
jgi:hypothetical protein